MIRQVILELHSSSEWNLDRTHVSHLLHFASFSMDSNRSFDGMDIRKEASAFEIPIAAAGSRGADNAFWRSSETFRRASWPRIPLMRLPIPLRFLLFMTECLYAVKSP